VWGGVEGRPQNAGYYQIRRKCCDNFTLNRALSALVLRSRVDYDQPSADVAGVLVQLDCSNFPDGSKISAGVRWRKLVSFVGETCA